MRVLILDVALVNSRWACKSIRECARLSGSANPLGDFAFCPRRLVTVVLLAPHLAENLGNGRHDAFGLDAGGQHLLGGLAIFCRKACSRQGASSRQC